MVIRKHCIELDYANKFNAKFQCTTQSYLQLNIYIIYCVNIYYSYIFFWGGGSMCLPILSPKPVAESVSVDFIGRRRLRASFI